MILMSHGSLQILGDSVRCEHRVEGGRRVFYWDFWIHNPHPENVRGDLVYVSVNYGTNDSGVRHFPSKYWGDKRHRELRTRRMINPVIAPKSYVKMSGIFDLEMAKEYNISLPTSFVLRMESPDRSAGLFVSIVNSRTYRFPIKWK